MSDEIKEILGSMSEYLEEKKKDYEEIVIKNGFPGDSIVYEVYYEDIKTLLDYITNLQEENEGLKEQLFDFKQNIYIQKASIPQKLTKDKTFMELYDMPTYEDYKSRCEKLGE